MASMPAATIWLVRLSSAISTRNWRAGAARGAAAPWLATLAPRYAGGWHGIAERGAAAGHALHADLAAQQFHQLLADGQAEAGAAEAAVVVGSGCTGLEQWRWTSALMPMPLSRTSNAASVGRRRTA
jgi:hypothetical protein